MDHLSPPRPSPSPVAPSPSPLALSPAESAESASRAGLARLRRYLEWCDCYRARPLPEAVVAFRHASVRVVSGQSVSE
jgi:hypothetical protein